MVKIFGSRTQDFCVAVIQLENEVRYYPFRGVYSRHIPVKVLAVSHWDFMYHYQENPGINDFLVDFFTADDLEQLWPKGEV